MSFGGELLIQDPPSLVESAQKSALKSALGESNSESDSESDHIWNPTIWNPTSKSTAYHSLV
jgi:hypothetical protein